MTDPLPPVAEDVLTQAHTYTEDETASEDPQALVAGLLSVIDLIEGDLAKVSGSYRRSLDARADLELHNEGLAGQVGFMERYRWRAARLEAASNRLLDALDPLIVTDPEGEHALGQVELDAAAPELERLLAADPIEDGHHYVSTACQHATHQPDLTDEQRQQLHDRCRLRCKFCEAGCACGCGHPIGDSEGSA